MGRLPSTMPHGWALQSPTQYHTSVHLTLRWSQSLAAVSSWGLVRTSGVNTLNDWHGDIHMYQGIWTVGEGGGGGGNDSVPSFGVPIFFYMRCDKFESRNFRHFSVSDFKLVVPLTVCEHV